MARGGSPLAPTTATKYRDQSRRIAGVIGDVPLSRLREADVERLRDELLERGNAGTTVNNTLRLLGSALEVAERRGLLRVPNPAAARHVERPSAKSTPAPVLEPEAARRILEAVVGDPVLDVAVHLALGGTLRRAEVLGLRWSAVDLEAGTLTITATYNGHGFAGPKSDAGVRVIPAAPFVLEALRRHRDAQAVAPIADALVLSNGGRPYNPTSLSRAWRLFREAHAELVPAGMTYHDLRHGAAQALVEAGVSREVIMRVAGWSADAMPELYAPGLSDEAARDVANRLQQQLGGRA
jgi:integrase